MALFDLGILKKELDLERYALDSFKSLRVKGQLAYII